MRRTKEEYFEKIKEIIKRKGGILLSNKYINSYTKIKVKCDKGHIWNAPPVGIMRNNWCWLCAKKKNGDLNKLTIEEMREIAKSKGWQCLSDKYIHSKTNLTWECDKGHIWRANPHNIKNGTGCPFCKNITIEEMREFARSKGWECLSDKYIHSKTKLTWKCDKGHIWRATPNDIKRGRKCPFCRTIAINRTKEEHFAKIKEIIKSRGGELLSNRHVNSRTKIRVKCDKGHIWDVLPAGIMKKHWCRQCDKDSRKLTIEKMREIAKSRGWKCLSDKYIGIETKLVWKCDKGHILRASPNHIKNGGGCSFCRTITTEKKKEECFVKIKEIIKNKRGLLLSNTYVDFKTKIRVKCDKGHIWDAQPERILRNKWCRQCACKRTGELNRLTIEDMKALAKSKGWECLSDKYIDNVTKLTWKCDKGHIWRATPHRIKNSRGCPLCLNITPKRTKEEYFEKIKKIIKSRGGVLLSNSYVNSSTKIRVKCDKGHIWDVRPGGIIRNNWCRRCENDSRKLTIEEMKEIAKSKGWECLSDKYTHCKTKLTWKCDKGHIWSACANYIKNGYGCPFCSTITIERMRELAKSKGWECLSSDKYIDNVTKLTWQCDKGHIWRATPRCIKDDTGCPFCRTIKTERKKEEYFEKIKGIIKSRGGVLLSNKYINSTTKIRVKCDKGHIWDVRPVGILRNDWCQICTNRRIGDLNRLTIEEMREIAKSRGWKCLSDKYIDMDTKLIWQCDKGHIWSAKPHGVKIGNRGCPFCSRTRRKTLEDMKNIAKSHEGECLSEKYINASKKLSWKCMNGHIWMATGKSVINGVWCPSCSNRKIHTTMEMRKLAKINNGKLLSKKYIRVDIPLKWQCEKGHIFESTPSRIITGYWCQRCTKDKMGRNIGSMCILAASFNGKCLSKEYVNSYTPLLWECNEGHRWKAKPGDVKDKRSWCKICKKNEIRQRKKYGIIDLRNIASTKEEKVISNEHQKLEFECKYGHRWKTLPLYVKRGKWCPTCKEEERLRYRLEKMRTLAKDKGGECLSAKYIHNNTKLTWKCKDGHIWENSPTKIKLGRWCTACMVEERRKNKLETMKKLARQHNGYCLSTKYYTDRVKLEWKCHKGHIWITTPRNIKDGYWCPYCSGYRSNDLLTK